MLKIGWSRKDISSDDPLPILGQFHLRISKGSLDQLLVNALTLENNGDYVIFLQADIVNFPYGMLDEIRAKVRAKNPEIDTLKIIANATHTHCGPGLLEEDKIWQDGPISAIPHEGVEIKPNGEYREFFLNSAAEAICESYENRKPGSIAYGYGYATVAHSRRVVYFDDISKRPENMASITEGIVFGHAQMYGNTNDDNFSHYEAGTDSYANFVFTFDENDTLTGSIINVPCPSQNSEMENFLTADFWADVRRELKKRYGDIYVLSQCAAAGDLSPRILHYKKAQDRRFRLKFSDYKMPEMVEWQTEMLTRLDIAERIADSFDEVYSWAQKEKFADLPVVHTTKTIDLKRRIVTEEELEASKLGYEKCMVKQDFVTDGEPLERFHTNSTRLTCGGRYEDAMKRYEEQKTSKTVPMELHVVKVGNIAFASNPFELFMDYQHRIQARSPFEQTFIVQLCARPAGTTKYNGGYLATQRGAEGNGYSASLYCNHVSPEGGQELVEKTLEELKKIY